MRVDLLTLFPEAVRGPLEASILRRAVAKGLLEVRIWDLRSFGLGRHRITDDTPFGGGGGMVLRPEPVYEAVDAITRQAGRGRILLFTPQGRPFDQAAARRLSRLEHLVLVCGHYEGFDERIRALADEEVSIGDYVLTGGELPALVVLDAVTRLVPGVIGPAAAEDSFAEGMLEWPQYTRPREYRGMAVPEVLLSGDHGRIRLWRRREALRRTAERRPDLFESLELGPEDRKLLREIQRRP